MNFKNKIVSLKLSSKDELVISYFKDLKIEEQKQLRPEILKEEFLKFLKMKVVFKTATSTFKFDTNVL